MLSALGVIGFVDSIGLIAFMRFVEFDGSDVRFQMLEIGDAGDARPPTSGVRPLLTAYCSLSETSHPLLSARQNWDGL